jgi:hypothetical protein
MKYPFKFLDAYSKDDIDIFFGRTDDIEALYRMLFETKMVWLYGASGTGKTSLIQCGLAGKFKSYDWFDLRITRGNNLVQSFDKSLADAAGDESSEDEEIYALFGTGERTVDVENGKKLTWHEKKLRSIYMRHFKPVYLIFDQFEELFILGSDDEQKSFLNLLCSLQQTEQPVKIIFCIREEYLGHLNRFERAIPGLLRKKLRLEPMDLGKIQEIMRSIDQLETSNVKVEGADQDEKDKIVEAIFDKVKDNEKTRTIQLPYLQVFLDKLYLKITNDSSHTKLAVISQGHVNSMGDINNVMREFLEDQVADIVTKLETEQPKKIEQKTIWAVLSPFVTIENTKEPILKQTLYERLHWLEPTIIDNILGHLIRRKILRLSNETGLYEIAHDSLSKPIADKRNKVENDLLEARQIIRSQFTSHTKTQSLIDEKLLLYIEPFLMELDTQKQLTGDELTLINRSYQKIQDDRDEAERHRKIELLEAKEELRQQKERAAYQEKLKQRGYIFAAIAVVTMIIAIVFYLQANKLKKSAIEANQAAQAAATEAKRNERISDSAYRELKKQQVLTVVTRIEKYGDDYKGNRQDALACENYRKALDSLKEYKTDTVYRRLLQKLSKCD